MVELVILQAILVMAWIEVVIIRDLDAIACIDSVWITDPGDKAFITSLNSLLAELLSEYGRTDTDESYNTYFLRSS